MLDSVGGVATEAGASDEAEAVFGSVACVAGAAGAFDVSAAVDAAGTVEGGVAGFASAAGASDVAGAVDAAGAVESVDADGTHCHLPERTHARS